MATTGENGRIFTVSELTRELKRLLEGSFRGITVRGEICEYSVRKEIVYFAIKDASSQIPVVFFRGAHVCQQLGLSIGSDVEVDGTVTLYEPQGRCQLSAFAIRPMGLGGLRLQFEQLKEKLRAQGLFDMERKKPIPPFPKCIGVITSPEGAALKDFLNVLGRRHSGVHVRIIPTQVQGKGAAEKMARALDYVNAYSLCDVIVVTRGGGSMEDLWPFNEEPLALAVSRSKIPVISAVGHERDYSICDFVADFRCATPSVAAEQVIEAKERLVDAVVNAHGRLRSALMYRLSEVKRRYERVSSSYFLAHPEEMVNYRRQRLDIACGRLGAVLPHRAEAARQRLVALTQRLKMLLPHLAAMRRQRYVNLAERLSRLSLAPFTRLHERLERGRKVLDVLGPESVLKRGYSILLKESGMALRAAEDASQGESLRGILANGEIRLKVER